MARQPRLIGDCSTGRGSTALPCESSAVHEFGTGLTCARRVTTVFLGLKPLLGFLRQDLNHRTHARVVDPFDDISDDFYPMNDFQACKLLPEHFHSVPYIYSSTEYSLSHMGVLSFQGISQVLLFGWDWQIMHSQKR